MAKTEKEAGETVCHKTVHLGLSTCMGSRCMAWDWHQTEHEYSHAKDDSVPPAGDGWESMEREPSQSNTGNWKRPRGARRIGDCGLKASMGPELNL